MEQIIVYKRDGRQIRLFCYRDGSGITKAEQIKELRGQDIVNIGLTSKAPLHFDIGDYINVFGWKYMLNLPPVTRKLGESRFEYELKFEGVQYQLIKVQYLDIDVNGFSTGVTFPLIGNLRTFAELIVRNAERVYGPGSFELGECPEDTETQNLDFSAETALQVLQRLCDVYEVQFYFEVLPYGSIRIHLKKTENILPLVFEYGRGRGLYQLERQSVSNKGIVTRLFAFGSERNLSMSYRGGSSRLKLPLSVIPSEGAPYIEDAEAIERYGVVEASITFDDIYPHRVGRVTDIDPTNINRFTDSAMSFDLNEMDGGSTVYLIPGQTAKITFNTGKLAGYTFDISESGGYSHEHRRFTLVPYTDSRGLTVPNEESSAFRIGIGDEYVITDIMMPGIYVTEAENRLLEKARDYLAKNSVPIAQYVLSIDPHFVEKKIMPLGDDNYFKVGDLVRVKDDQLGINGLAPITGFTRDLLNHFRYDLTLGEERISRTGAMYHILRTEGIARAVDTLTSRRLATTVRTTVMVDPRGEVAW